MKLAGKVALVTGAQQGIGAAIAVALAGEGADVALTWLDDQAGAEAVAGKVRKAGRRAHLMQADVARLPEIEAMVAETVEALGAPDILVNNAGVYPRVPLLEMRESDWDYVLDINLKAGCFATIAMAKALIAAGKKSGAVINLSSSAIRGAVRGVHYSASKGGVVSMTRAHGARAGAARHPRQCHRPRPHRHRPAALRQHRCRARRHGPNHHPAGRPSARARADRAHRRVPCVR